MEGCRSATEPQGLLIGRFARGTRSLNSVQLRRLPIRLVESGYRNVLLPEWIVENRKVGVVNVRSVLLPNVV